MTAATRLPRAAPCPAPRSWRGGVLSCVLLIAACTAAPNGAVARAAPDSFAPLVKRVHAGRGEHRGHRDGQRQRRR